MANLGPTTQETTRCKPRELHALMPAIAAAINYPTIDILRCTPYTMPEQGVRTRCKLSLEAATRPWHRQDEDTIAAPVCRQRTHGQLQQSQEHK
jgi:hypothetical protein